MKTELMNIAAELVDNPKIVAGVSIVTAGSGLSTMFNLVSNGVGLVASFAGLLLAVVLIRKSLLEHNKIKMEMEAYRAYLKDRQDREDAGEPLRREHDHDQSL